MDASPARSPLSPEERQALARFRKQHGGADRLGAVIGIAGTTLARMEQGCTALPATRRVVSAWLAAQSANDGLPQAS